MITEKDILKATHKGLNIFQSVLSYYYEESLLLGFSGKKCLPAHNPFNEGKLTLQISLMDDVFVFQDDELPGVIGNAIDFASLHYQLEGDALLEKINQDMNLLMGEKKVIGMDRNKGLMPVFVLEMPEFSFYRCPVTNTKPEKQLTLLETWKLITGESYKERTMELRNIADPEAASQFKQTRFDYVTFSGVFSKRSDAAIVSHSGLLTIDFDHVENLTLVKEALRNDPSSDLGIDMMFESPSGHGLKCIISIDVMTLPHKYWFDTLVAYFKSKYNLEVDRSGKDLSRACFLCHDPHAWIHPIYLI